MPGGVLTGFFGKLPRTGDFVSRGLPADLRRAVDRWLAYELEAGREPPEAGRVAQLSMAGRLATLASVPSRDRLGRRFPLAAVASGLAGDPAAAEAWAAAALPHLHAAAAGTLSPDGLLEALLGIPPPLETAPSQP